MRTERRRNQTHLNAIPSRKLVTKNASATVNSAKYWLNVRSCVCRNTMGWYVSVEKRELICDTRSATPPASSFDSVVCSATWMSTVYHAQRSGCEGPIANVSRTKWKVYLLLKLGVLV
jgi:hypothetical protein